MSITVKTQSVRVFVLDRNRNPLMPCCPARAKELLKKGRAKVFRAMPFTIIVQRSGGVTQLTEVCIDPGSKTSGLAIRAFFKRGWTVIWVANLHHRGHQIHLDLIARKAIRRGRRNRNTGYRRCKYVKPVVTTKRRKARLARNAKYASKAYKDKVSIRLSQKPSVRYEQPTKATCGNKRLPPSVKSRIDNIAHWTKKLSSLLPAIKAIYVETVQFDQQKMMKAEIAGKEYQQGTLFEFDVMQYLLVKYNHTCVYCDRKSTPDNGVRLEKDHVKPVSKGGSNRLSNLVLACKDCNATKTNKDLSVFLANKPNKLKQLIESLKVSLRDSAVMNSMRKALVYELELIAKTLKCAVHETTGSLTKYNRISLKLPKDRNSHYLDAACLGYISKLTIPRHIQALEIKAIGRGNRHVVGTDKYGFPRLTKAGNVIKPGTCKRIDGFQTGDRVKLNMLRGKYQGSYIANLATIRARGDFDVKVAGNTIGAVSKRYKLIQHTNGYNYSYTTKEDIASLWSKIA